MSIAAAATPLAKAERPLAFTPAGAAPPSAPAVEAPAVEALAAAGRSRRAGLRLPLLIAGPLAVAAGALWLYLSGGRYVTTDDAYVGADKVMVAPQVTGVIGAVAVREGQKVAAGDALFEIESEPYRIAVDAAQAKMAEARTELAALKESYAKTARSLSVARDAVTYRSRNLGRVNALADRQFAAQSALDTAQYNMDVAQGLQTYAEQDAKTTLAKLEGDASLPLDRFAPYREAKAAADAAQRNLRLTRVLAPIAGVATQTDLLLPGRFAAAGTPALAVVSDDVVWVDANQKETDLEHLAIGQTATVVIDSYPDRTFRGVVASIGPGTGAQFSVLPAQNVSGNWVKVVQRVPVRIRLERQAGDPPLRAGMSATVAIDTGRRRALGDLL